MSADPAKTARPAPEPQASATAPGPKPGPRVLVLGLGGCGCHVVAGFRDSWTDGFSGLAADTDVHSLPAADQARTLHLKLASTKGLSTGGALDLGRRAVQENKGALTPLLAGVDLVFLVAGLGGGTGTGGVVPLAELARSAGALVMAFVTLPFAFEGQERKATAEKGLSALRVHADAVVVVPNERLLGIIQDKTTLPESFRAVSETLAGCMRSTWRLLRHAGVLNLDFSVLRQLLRHSHGVCSVGYAEASGENKVRQVVDNLIHHPLLDGGRLLSKAAALIVGVTGGPDMPLKDVQDVTRSITVMAPPDAHLALGAAIHEGWQDRLAVTLVVGEKWAEPEPVTPPEDAGRGRRKKPEQSELPLGPDGRGRFKDVDPTFYDGQDLDTPTYIRRNITLGQAP